VPTQATIFAQWLDTRTKLRQERDALRERAHDALVPVARQWCEERQADDPITGSPAFRLSIDEINVERAAPNKMLRRMTINSYSGVVLSISVPDGAAAIWVETTSSQHQPRNTRYDDVRRTAPNANVPDPHLDRKDGTTTHHDRFADVLARFEKEALAQ
jgi:hypothetical protein